MTIRMDTGEKINVTTLVENFEDTIATLYSLDSFEWIMGKIAKELNKRYGDNKRQF